MKKMKFSLQVAGSYLYVINIELIFCVFVRVQVLFYDSDLA